MKRKRRGWLALIICVTMTLSGFLPQMTAAAAQTNTVQQSTVTDGEGDVSEQSDSDVSDSSVDAVNQTDVSTMDSSTDDSVDLEEDVVNMDAYTSSQENSYVDDATAGEEDTVEQYSDDADSGQVVENDNSETEEQEQIPSVSYQVHCQTYGWMTEVADGAQAGTSGQAKRLEAIKIRLQNLPEKYSGSSIVYSTHVQTYGWQSEVKDGAQAGTSGEAKRLEAITIKLTGPIAEDYSVYYRVHAQTFGWLGWAHDGEKAGSASYAKRLEAIEIVLVKKDGGSAPVGNGTAAYRCPLVSYQVHQQSYGWESTVYDNTVGGVTGQSKRLEALKISLPDVEGATGYTGGISYRAYVQSYGWQDWKSDGQLAGTTGQSKRIEALSIKLTGEVASYYDVYYSVHLSKIGWTGYVCGGDSAIAGSTDLSKRIEAVKIQLVKKGDTPPSTSGTTFISGYKTGDLTYSAKVQDGTTSGPVTSGQTAGTTGQSKRIEGITINLNKSGKTAVPSGEIQYAVHLSSVGWTGWSSTGQFCGSSNGANGMEAVKIQLTGDLAKYYDIYYRAYIQDYGWLGWAKNGQAAGSTKIGYRMEAIQIQLVSKDASAPGANSGYYTETKKSSCPDASMEAKANQYSSSTKYIIMVNGATHKVGIFQGKKGSWTNIKYWSCGDGKSSTPTVRGVFTVGSKGYYFDSGKYRCFWYTQFYGNYLFHSVLCWPNGTVADGRVGLGISHGCVRLEVANAKWIYDNIPKGTTVVVYN